MRHLLTAFIGLLLAACTGIDPAPAGSSPSADAITIRKPSIDERDYRYVTLPNGLRALLVSDRAADKAAAALLVETGSYDEPADRPGLAHFLEHMLFLGTDRYPDPDEFAAFVSTHGGSHNAYTSGDHTNYFLEIAPSEFDGAVDRFAQFFVAPRFAAEYVDREKNAVHSEYQLQLKDDGWRANAVERIALSSAHPASRFNIGSLDTLADRAEQSTRDALLAFFATHYDPRQMILALYAPQPVEALEALAARVFGAVPQRTPRAARTGTPLFAADGLGKRLQFRPEKNTRKLTFTFPLPPVDAHWRENPMVYIANLLGHEGEGSLHAHLKRKGYIESLGASGGRVDAANAVLAIEIELTEQGLDHVDDIGTALFGAISLVRRQGVLERLYAEQARIAALAFDYREPQDATGTVVSLTRDLMRFPPADVLRGETAMERFDADLIAAYLGALRPDNVMVAIAAPEVATDQVEEWFRVPYAFDALPAEWLAHWRTAEADPALAIPAPNPFVPEDLGLLADAERTDTARPDRVANPLDADLWHLADSGFGAPRANLMIRFATCTPLSSARDAAIASLYARLVDDGLNIRAYPAELAGLGYTIGFDDEGLRLKIAGFDDKQSVLLDQVMAALATQPIADDRFALHRDELLREWANAARDRPSSQVVAELARLVTQPSVSPTELIAALEPVTPSDVGVWRARTLHDLHVEMLAHGNVDANEASGLLGIVARHVASIACNPAARDVLAVTEPAARELPVEHDDSALVFYVQGSSRADAERARFGLLAHMLRETYFNALRTERQLGYLVAATPTVIERVPGISFIVQSPVAGAGKVLSATRDFLGAFRDGLATMTGEAFEAERAGLLTRLLARDRNLADRTRRLWREIDDDVHTFDSRERLAAEIGRLSLADFRAFVDEFVARSAGHTVAVYSRGRFADDAPNGAAIEDRAAFQSTLAPVPL